MKNYNDESRENLIKTLIDDKVGRRDTVFDLIKVLFTINNNRIIAINGAWGSGKTFFVKHLELLINYINNCDVDGNLINSENRTNNLKCLTELSDADKSEINKLLEQEEHKKTRDLFDANKRMNCIYFNAWEYDNNEEPILSIIYKTIKDFPYLEALTEDVKIKFETILKNLVSYFTKGIINPSDLIEKTNFIEKIQTSEDIKGKCNELFEELLVENADKMVIVIDELDRCRPMYAIKLLEQIKHYIKSDNIVIVLTINMKQLSYTIKNLYGYDFNTEEYLDKIVDLTLSLKPVDKKTYLNSLFSNPKFNSSQYHTMSILDYANYKNINMREMNRYLSIMMVYENVQGNEYGFKKFYRIFRYVFLPYFIGQQMFDYKKYEEFITGKGFNDFYKYIESSDNLIQIIEYDLKINPESSNKINEYIKLIYDATYNTSDINDVARSINGKQLTMIDINKYNELCSILKNFNLNITREYKKSNV